MDIFFNLSLNLIPLYILIAAGWVAGRVLGIEGRNIGTLVIFMIVPVVTFGYIANMDIQKAFILPPIAYFTIITVSLFTLYAIGRKIYPDSRANLLAMCGSQGNTGYFGLPLAILLLPEPIVGVYMIANIGSLLAEATVLYYIANRGHFSVKQSLIRLAKFPNLYAIIFGLIFSIYDIPLPDTFHTYFDYFKGAYIVLGMMIIGLALAKVNKLVLPPVFVSLSFAGKFLLVPVLALTIIAVDRTWLHFGSAQIYLILFILSITPTGANVAAFAETANLNATKAASVILLSTIFALIYVPLALVLYGYQ